LSPLFGKVHQKHGDSTQNSKLSPSSDFQSEIS
jgi:hypothetical protein